MSVQIN